MKSFLLGALTGILGLLLVVGAGAAVFLNLGGGSGTAPKVFAEVDAIESLPSVQEHTKIFKRRIEEPVPGVHVAIGFGLANAILIDAPDGLIMVDTLETQEAARSLLPYVDELRKQTGKQITDIIYTHNHTDHVLGAGIFVESQETVPNIWAHPGAEARVYEIVNVLRPVIFKRAMRQYGVFLPQEAYENSGIGEKLVFDETTSMYFVPPTKAVLDGMEVELAGEKVVFRHAPGETPDQLLIWLPDREALLPADNFYHAFPNLYTLRGTPYRDVQEWALSVDKMLAFDAAALIPQHGPAILGADEIRETLTNYRDAISFVHDQTIRYINEGLTPDEIVELVKLPPHLAQAPYLQEFYGQVDWAVRSVFTGTLGWFSGDPADLIPPTPDRQAELIARLAGGTETLRTEFDRAMSEGEANWALILAGHMRRLGVEDASALQAKALRDLAAGMTASTGRNYMLTMAAEAEGFEIPESQLNDTPQDFFENIDINNFMRSLPVALKAEDVLDTETAYGFNFTDLPEPMTLRIRRGVAVLESGIAEDVQGTLTATTSTFKAIVTKRTTPVAALANGSLSFDNGPLIFNGFMAHFDTP